MRRWGWTADAPGAWAELELDTRRDASDGAPEAPDPSSLGGSVTTTVMLGYMRSYESMGDGLAQCVGGCTCEMVPVLGTWERHATLMQMAEVQVRGVPTSNSLSGSPCWQPLPVAPQIPTSVHRKQRCLKPSSRAAPLPPSLPASCR